MRIRQKMVSHLDMRKAETMFDTTKECILDHIKHCKNEYFDVFKIGDTNNPTDGMEYTCVKCGQCFYEWQMFNLVYVPFHEYLQAFFIRLFI